MRPVAVSTPYSSSAIPAPRDGDVDTEGKWGSVPADKVNYDTLSKDEIAIVRGTAITFGWVIFGCKFAIPPNIEVSYFVVMGYVLWMLWRGYAVIGPVRAITYLLIAFTAVGITLFNPLVPRFSVTSVLFLVGVHIPFMFTGSIRRIVYLNILKWVAFFCAIIAGLVAFQWCQQLLGFKMISMEDYVPQTFMFDNYNYIQKVNFFSRYYKPNAFFMLETSHTSQILAIGMLIELCILRRPIRFAILSVAMISTFGGTGIFMILGCAPLILFYLRFRMFLAILIAIPLMSAAAVGLGVTKSIESRSTEFGRAGSSGNGRFIRPWEIMMGTLSDNREAATFGIGGGADNPRMVYKGTDLLPPAAKIISEYGIPLGLCFLVWFHVIVFTSGVPLVITIAALLQFDIVGGALLIPLETYYVLLLSAILLPNRLSSRRAAIPERAWRPRWGPRRLGPPSLA